MGSCSSCCGKNKDTSDNFSYSTLGSLTYKGTGTAFSTQNLQLCQGCRVPWNNETNRAGPCDRCIVRQKDRCSLIEEFLQTEIVYNDHLVSLREFYNPVIICQGVEKPLDSSTLLTPAEHTKIFAELKDLLYLSNRVICLLNDAIKSSIQHGDQHLERVEIGRILFRVLPHYSCFVPFIIKQETNLQVLTELESTSEDFRLLLWEADISDIRSLEKLFQKPSLRIQRLPSFVDQILDKTPLSHSDRKSLQNTQLKVQELLKSINKYSVKKTPAIKDRKAPPKPKRKMKKSKTSPKQDEFGRTFTKTKSLNPFDSSSSSSSEYHEVESGSEVSAPKTEHINCDSLDRAFKDLEKSIEFLEAHTKVPKVQLNSSDGTQNKTTNLSVIEETTLGSTSNSSFEGSLRLSPRMARATILRPRSASPNQNGNHGEHGDHSDQEYNDIWEKRSSSPGIIEYLSDNVTVKSPKIKKKRDSPNKDKTTCEDEGAENKAKCGEKSEDTSTACLTENTSGKMKTTSVSSTIGDDFFFDERDFYGISDADESELSLDEFELRSKGSELELSDLESEKYWTSQKSRTLLKPIEQNIAEEEKDKTLTRSDTEADS